MGWAGLVCRDDFQPGVTRGKPGLATAKFSINVFG